MDNRSPDGIEAGAQRDADLVRLRREGQTFEAIGAELGFSRQYACRRFWELMKENVVAEVSDYRAEQLDRYDWLIREATDVLKAEHVTVSHGKVIYDDRTGNPMLDSGPKLAAIRELRAIEAQRTDLLGTKTPVKVDVAGSVKFQYEFDGAEDV